LALVVLLLDLVAGALVLLVFLAGAVLVFLLVVVLVVVPCALTAKVSAAATINRPNFLNVFMFLFFCYEVMAAIEQTPCQKHFA
jgi:hypothetical protein